MSEEALQIAVKRREMKGKGEKERYTHLNAEFQRIARRDKKSFFSDQCKEIEKTIEWERPEISSRKVVIPREHFMQRSLVFPILFFFLYFFALITEEGFLISPCYSLELCIQMLQLPLSKPKLEKYSGT